MSESGWHFVDGDKSVGPVSKSELRKRFQDGMLDRITMVWQEDSPSWVRAGDVPGLLPPPIPGVSDPSPKPPAERRPVPPAIPFESPQAPAGSAESPDPDAGPVMTLINYGMTSESIARMVADGTLELVEEPEFAGFWRRAIAFSIDFFAQIILALFVMAIYIYMTNVIGLFGGFDWEDVSNMDDNSAWAFGLLFGWVYYAFMESSRYQATLGKLVLRMKVTDLAGERITLGRASKRYFGRLVSALLWGIGFIMAGFTQKKQTLHDMMAGCLVVRRQIALPVTKRPEQAPAPPRSMAAKVGSAVALLGIAMFFGGARGVSNHFERQIPPVTGDLSFERFKEAREILEGGQKYVWLARGSGIALILAGVGLAALGDRRSQDTK